MLRSERAAVAGFRDWHGEGQSHNPAAQPCEAAELYAKQPQDAQMTEERSEDKALLDDELLEVITDSPEQLIENACINRMSA